MQTSFSLAQLADPEIAAADPILRACVHCGFCTATCPTYLLLGDELDGPRGRIYLMKNNLERDEQPGPDFVTHIDRCLSCYACMTTCPSGVNYMHLVDPMRHRIEQHYRRPFADRMIRAALNWTLPYPTRFRWALFGARIAKLARAFLPGRLGAMVKLAPARMLAPTPLERPQFFPAEGERRMRVALLAGCVQQVIAPEINAATIRLLTRHGSDVAIVDGSRCCGSLSHHLGKDSLSFARANIDAWMRAVEGEGLDAIVINASGCGTTVKDYGFMLRADTAYADKAAKISALAKDVSEVMAMLGIKPAGAERPPSPNPLPPSGERERIVVAYHSACSMQHAQHVNTEPRALLRAAGFEVAEIPEGHLCCGSAGTYNMLQPALADALRARKLDNIDTTGAAIVATGNIGCIAQLQSAARPVVHTVELLDWATGGPKPASLEGTA
ncbi:MAG TPA: glycolate oxidase subunit GlcF [Stellaceae bacterium]|nr:glycolate oxidase subunit GlcF [Stellaceae bacterium]